MILPREAIDKVVSANLRNVFKKAKRNKYGDMILRQSAWIRFVCLLLLVLFCCTAIFFYEDENLEVAAVVGLLTVCLAFGVAALLISKVVVSDQEMISYKWYGKRRMKLSDLKSIQYSSLWGGSIVLRDSSRAITIPTEYAGAAEFVKHLVERLGPEFCSNATYAIRLREKEMIRKRNG